jgi:hypothetical protein
VQNAVDIQLQQKAPLEQRPVARSRCAFARPHLLDWCAAASDSGSASSICMIRVIVEGELGNWHERDTIDPAIPDIPRIGSVSREGSGETIGAEAQPTSNHRAPRAT